MFKVTDGMGNDINGLGYMYYTAMGAENAGAEHHERNIAVGGEPLWYVIWELDENDVWFPIDQFFIDDDMNEFDGEIDHRIQSRILSYCDESGEYGEGGEDCDD